MKVYDNALYALKAHRTGRRDMDILKLELQFPQVADMADGKKIIWFNVAADPAAPLMFGMNDIEDAEARLRRFAPYIMAAFPETRHNGGIIESPLVEIQGMKEKLGIRKGRLFLKMDSHLAVSGSIKARGGIYEVLKFAEKTAVDAGMLNLTDDYSRLLRPEFIKLFSKYNVAVGSTGNLGLSIGIISARLGFKVTVHMSVDARRWKKELLRSKGVTVIEYPDNYQKAVAEGRKLAGKDPFCHFVDDEDSEDLFMGYSVAAKRLAPQLRDAGIKVDRDHPLFVYIPCGVGGAPGGVSFGLRKVIGPDVHIFFAEPTHAPCMTLGMMTGLNDGISVYDIGLDGKTAADGLAVGRASKLVGTAVKHVIDGCFTVDDEELYTYLAYLQDTEGIFIEPSACAAFPGPALITDSRDYLEQKKLADSMDAATHVIWATGGSMVPDDERETYYDMGKVK